MKTLNWKTPLLLYLATFFTTTFCRFGFDDNVLFHFLYSMCLTAIGGTIAPGTFTVAVDVLWDSLMFSVPLMFLLTCHEFGHYFQTRRYGMYSSLPYFLPVPFGLFGTFGAVIAMDDRVPHGKALFDIGITGPLAGLVPTLFFLYFGLQWSHIGPLPPDGTITELGDPLLMTWAINFLFGNIPPDMTLYIHPVAMAAWTGLLLTSINLFPFGQLDGGHVFHALLGRWSVPLTKIGFFVVLVLVFWYHLWHWTVLLLLLALMGISHPPTQNDTIPLGWFRRCLGIATLLFVIAGFTPTPIALDSPQPQPNTPRWYTVQSPPFLLSG